MRTDRERPPCRPRRKSARERHISEEIVVDAYTSDERALTWYCSLAEMLAFPFRARCVAQCSVAAEEARKSRRGCHGERRRLHGRSVRAGGTQSSACRLRSSSRSVWV